MLFTFMACIFNMSLLHFLCQATYLLLNFSLKTKCLYYLYMFKLLVSEYFLLASQWIAMTNECCGCYSSHCINSKKLDQLREK